MDDLDSLRIALEGERHCHGKDNEYLLARAQRAETRVRKAAWLFGVPDGGQYWNDWLETKKALDRHFEAAREIEAVAREAVVLLDAAVHMAYEEYSGDPCEPWKDYEEARDRLKRCLMPRAVT